MCEKYIHYTEVTREVLDTIKVGDLVRVNDWIKPMKVKSVSENYFVMTQSIFGNTYYSVCSKLPWDGIRYNNMVGGMFHCGCDDWIFGSPLTFIYENVYQFNNEESNKQYLQDFEDGKTSISNGVAIYDLYVKSC